MKHTDLIHTIIEAERQAQELAAEAQNKKLHLREDLRADEEMLRQKYAKQADERIETMLAQENEYTDAAIREAGEAHRAEMEQMEKLYAAHRAEWIEKIYAMIIEPS